MLRNSLPINTVIMYYVGEVFEVLIITVFTKRKGKRNRTVVKICVITSDWENTNNIQDSLLYGWQCPYAV